MRIRIFTDMSPWEMLTKRLENLSNSTISKGLTKALAIKPRKRFTLNAKKKKSEGCERYTDCSLSLSDRPSVSQPDLRINQNHQIFLK